MKQTIDSIRKILDAFGAGKQIQKRSHKDYRDLGIANYPKWEDIDLGDLITHGAEYRVKPKAVKKKRK